MSLHVVTRPLCFLGVIATLAAMGVTSRCFAEEDTRATANDKAAAAGTASVVSGREIFAREWLPNDPRSHGGDGLGPVFNDSSCIACHNQGGEGGGGPASKNVDIVSASLSAPLHPPVPQKSVIGSLIGLVFGGGQPANQVKQVPPTTEQLKRHRQNLVKEVTRIHPGFGSARSVVIHKSGFDKGYEKWRLGMTGMNQFVGMGIPQQMVNGAIGIDVGLEKGEGVAQSADDGEKGRTPKALTPREQARATQEISSMQAASFNVNGPFFSGAHMKGSFTLSPSQRNPTALFGVGLIDSIPVKVLEEAAKRRFTDFPKVSGRVAKLPGDKVGRFGWKAQKATLHDFTMTACAVELGLHVPEHPQSGLPSRPDYKPTGFDLNQMECNALVGYLRNLPAPTPRQPASDIEATYLAEGAKLFASVGCAACHTEKLGEVNGIYSDLLLHDMGPGLGDTGSYGVFIPDSPGGDADSPVPPLAQFKTKPAQSADVKGAKVPTQGAGRLEWRTPPLWGVRDSAPYLHDGRAKNIEQAVSFHGGEATQSTRRYFLLSVEDRHKVQVFLKSLGAPTQIAQK